jgi:DNA-directed RNA polymerase alpha subunit
MRTHPRSTRRRAAVAGLLVVLALLVAPACAKKYQAEKDGKDIGQSLCDVRDADTPEEARSALQDFNEQVDDLSADVSTFTAEDRADIEEQVSDLVQHVGDDLLVQQDLTVIRRSLENIKDDLGDSGQAAIDGFFEGIDDCDG